LDATSLVLRLEGKSILISFIFVVLVVINVLLPPYLLICAIELLNLSLVYCICMIVVIFFKENRDSTFAFKLHVIIDKIKGAELRSKSIET
jgi:hypothetical protein